MKHAKLVFSEFDVVTGNDRSQAAVMVLAPGESEGDRHNRHRGADQWLYVLSGTGLAVVDDVPVDLVAGTLLLIEHGETHEVANTGDAPLQTLNFYVPPAYTSDEKTLPAGRP